LKNIQSAPEDSTEEDDLGNDENVVDENKKAAALSST
jgi:hypothetical protein